MDSIWAGTDVYDLFNDEIQPIADSAQSRVLIPEGLDLDTWICPMDPNDFMLPSNHSHNSIVQDLIVTEEVTKVDSKAVILDKGTTNELQSIINKPKNRKYDLRQNFEDGLLLRHEDIGEPPKSKDKIDNAAKDAMKKKKKHKRSGSELKEKLQIHITGKKYKIWQNDEMKLEISWPEQPQSFIEKLKVRVELFVSLSNDKGAPILFNMEPLIQDPSIRVVQLYDKYKILVLRLERPNLESLFSKHVGLNLILPEIDRIKIEFDLPMDFNFLLPNQPEMATMTPPKFMKILQNPPLGFFSAVGTSNIVLPDDMKLDQVCNLVANHINCIIVERHFAASSLFGIMSNGVMIVGLVKERQNQKGRKMVSIEIKTGDSKVLEWVIDVLTNFAADLL